MGWKKINEFQEQRRFVLKDETASITVTREEDDEGKYVFTSDVNHYQTQGGTYTRMSLDAVVEKQYFKDDTFVITLMCDLFQRAYLSRNIGEYAMVTAVKNKDFGEGETPACPKCESEMLVRITDDDDSILFGRCASEECDFEVNLEDDSIYRNLYIKIEPDDILEVDLEYEYKRTESKKSIDGMVLS